MTKKPRRLSTASSSISAAPTPIVIAPITWLRADLGIEDAAGRAHREHAAHADLAGGGIDADLDEMRAEGRLLVLLVEVAVFDRVLGDELAVAGAPRRAARCGRPTRTWPSANTASAGVEAELLRHRLAQLHAGRVDAGGRAVAAPLAARAGRDRESASRRAARPPCSSGTPIISAAVWAMIV